MSKLAHSAGPLGVLRHLHGLPKTLAIIVISFIVMPLQCTTSKLLLKHVKKKVIWLAVFYHLQTDLYQTLQVT